MKGWYRTSSWIKKEFGVNMFSQYSVFLPHHAIIELVIPNCAKIVNCANNYITELIVPDSVYWIDCRGNKINELIVPDNCKVKCDPHVKLITKTMYNRSKRLKNILK